MKVRHPDFLPPPLTPVSRSSADTLTLTYTVTTLTPIYGGGVTAGSCDLDMPVRVASIRGQLRFWWRLLKSQHPAEPLQKQALFEAERALWGGMSEGDQDHASQVRLRVAVNGKKSDLSLAALKQRQKQKDRQDILDYVLFPARENKQSSALIDAGLKFTLTVTCEARCSPAQRDEVRQTLRWWASFGGLGARTRRGLGAIEVSEGGKVLAPVTVAEARAAGCDLVTRKRHGQPMDAWFQAVEKLRDFRQKPGIARNPGSGPHPGRSRWPEPDSIREITGQPNLTRDPDAPHQPVHPARRSFPRAALGLPILFEFKDKKTDPYKTELIPLDYDRMASPLILKPQALGNSQYASIALRLPLDHLERLTLVLKRSGGNNQTLQTLNRTQWWQDAKASQVKPISDYQGTDAISAFLTYFGN